MATGREGPRDWENDMSKDLVVRQNGGMGGKEPHLAGQVL